MPAISWIPFRWEGAHLGERYFPHAAIFLPGRLPALDDLTGWFQFDLGAPTSVLYGASLNAALRARVAALPREPHPARFNGQPVPLVRLPLRVGPWEISPLIYLQDFGEQDLADDGQPLLGSVGGDLVREHILVLDFPNQRLALLEALPPTWEAQIAWAPLRLTEHGHVVLQIEVDGARRWAMFDSGSSLFHLLTDPLQWQQLTTGEVTERFPIAAWGQAKEVCGGPARRAFSLGGQPLSVPVVHYLEGEDERRFLEAHDLIGLLGNAPFLQVGLVLDFPQRRAGMLAALAA